MQYLQLYLVANDNLMTDFLAQLNDKLMQLDTTIVTLENDPTNPDHINAIFRIMHTIKGEAGFLKLEYLQNIAHACENIMGKIRDQQLHANKDVISIVFDGIDEIKHIAQSLHKDTIHPIRENKIFLKLATGLLNGSIKSNKPLPEIESTAVQKAQASISTPNEQVDPLTDQYVKLSTNDVESLIKQIGELVINRNELITISNSIQHQELNHVANKLSSIINNLQDQTLTMHMQPIDNIWERLPRIIRDICANNGKHVNVQTQGNRTHMDRNIINKLHDIFVHLIRNAVDHGIESPQDRLDKGKPKEGTIDLIAEYENNHIICTIADDGAGINIDQIQKKALSSKAFTPQKMKALRQEHANDNDFILSLLMTAGFSTKDTVDQLSGRGVGLNSVAHTISQINGTIHLETSVDKGSKFKLHIPMTLTIMDSAILKININDTPTLLALPQSTIVRCIKVQDIEIKTIDNENQQSHIMEWNNQLIPVLYMHSLFGDNDTKLQIGHVIIAKATNQYFAIVVQAITDIQEIVVKAVPDILQAADIFMGATILADGYTAMILDVKKLYRRLTRNNAPHTQSQHQTIQNVHCAQPYAPYYLLFTQNNDLHAIAVCYVASIIQIECKQIKNNVLHHGNQLIPVYTMEKKLDHNHYNAILIQISAQQIIAFIVTEISGVMRNHSPLKTSNDKALIIGQTIEQQQVVNVININYIAAKLLPTYTEKTLCSRYINATYDEVLIFSNDYVFITNHVHLFHYNNYQLLIARHIPPTITASKIIIDMDFQEINPFDVLKNLTTNYKTPIIGISNDDISLKKHEYCLAQGMNATNQKDLSLFKTLCNISNNTKKAQS